MGAGGVDDPPVDALGVVDGLPGDVRCPESVTSCISTPGHMSQLRICSFSAADSVSFIHNC